MLNNDDALFSYQIRRYSTAGHGMISLRESRHPPSEKAELCLNPSKERHQISCGKKALKKS